ncbi:hypothetical protein [uncultured Actinomyces sp.]|uniref:hypothetical protein n=1 Tax=uncultured Actinomyces sp. TaxID=249061 RepID=UPI0028E53310|nr:hypothetical protein [uncultured Actinomyces sp.]
MTNTTRHALPLPVTLLIAWAVGIAVFLALRALTTLIPQPTNPTLTLAQVSASLTVVVLVPTGTSLASALTLPRTRAGSLPLTLASALPAPILAYTYIGALIGALPPWLIRRHRAERRSLTD